MKYLGVFLFISVPAFADVCSQVEIKGTVRTDKVDMHLVMASKTMSQKKYEVYGPIQSKLSPYINHYVKIKGVLKKDELVDIDDVADDVADPLNQNQSSELKKLKEIKCP